MLIGFLNLKIIKNYPKIRKICYFSSRGFVIEIISEFLLGKANGSSCILHIIKIRGAANYFRQVKASCCWWVFYLKIKERPRSCWSYLRRRPWEGFQLEFWFPCFNQLLDYKGGRKRVKHMNFLIQLNFVWCILKLHNQVFFIDEPKFKNLLWLVSIWFSQNTRDKVGKT